MATADLLPDSVLLTEDDELGILAETLRAFDEMDDVAAELAVTGLVRVIGIARGPVSQDPSPWDDLERPVDFARHGDPIPAQAGSSIARFDAQSRLADVWDMLEEVTREYLTAAQRLVESYDGEIGFMAPGLAGQIGAAMEHEVSAATARLRLHVSDGTVLAWRMRPPRELVAGQWSLWDLIELARDALRRRHDGARLAKLPRLALGYADAARVARNLLIHRGTTLTAARDQLGTLLHFAGLGPKPLPTTFWHVFARDVRNLA